MGVQVLKTSVAQGSYSGRAMPVSRKLRISMTTLEYARRHGVSSKTDMSSVSALQLCDKSSVICSFYLCVRVVVRTIVRAGLSLAT